MPPTGQLNRNDQDALSDERNPARVREQQQVDPKYVNNGIGDIEDYLRQQEAASAAGGSGGDDLPPSKQSLYSGDGTNEPGASTKQKSRLSRLFSKAKSIGWKAQAAIAGVIAVGVVIILSLLGLSSLQAVHLAQILALDQTNNITYADIRTQHMFRYVLSGGDQGEARVSWLGSEIFGDTRSKLLDIGVTFDDNSQLGLLRGGTIDTNKFPVTKDVPREQRAATLATYFRDNNIGPSDIVMRGDQASINGLGVAATKAFANKSVAQLDGGRISYFVRSRQVMKFFNLPTIFHPLRIVDRKITEGIDTRDQLRRAVATEKTGIEYKPSSRQQAYQDFKDRTSGVRAAADGALLFIGGVCIARSAADAAITYNRDAIVAPQALEAAHAQAIGSQQQSGQDFSNTQINVNNQNMTDADGKSIWDATALQAKTNPSVDSGEDIPLKYGQAFNESTGAGALKDLGGPGAAAACSTPGQIAQGVLGGALLAVSIPTGSASTFAYGSLKALGGVAVGAATMAALHELIADSLEDEPIPENASAPTRGNLMAYGSRELANINARAGGGVELSEQESAMADRNMAQINRQDFANKTYFAQMFDVKDYRSVAGRFSMTLATPRQTIKKMAISTMNVGSIFGSTLKNILPKADAASQYDYGFNRYGIPDRILNNREYTDPYKNAAQVVLILDGASGTDYIDRASKCFGVTIARDSDNRWGVTPTKDVNPLSEDYESGNCNRSDDTNWDRIIMFVSDSTTMEANACYLGKEDSCKILGAAQEENVCSLNSPNPVVGVDNMPSWVKMPVINAQPGAPVKGDVSIALANIKDRPAVQPSLRIIVGNDPDFIGLNEVSDTSLDALKSYLPGYGAYRDNTPNDGIGGEPTGNAIMYNKDRWDFVDGGRIKTADNDQTFYNGSPRTWDRWAMWGIFKRKSDGAVVPVVITHAMTNPGKYPAQHSNPKLTRIQQYALSMDVLLELTNRLSAYGPVLVAGDMNSQRDQGKWSAVPKMEAAGYGYTNDVDVLYAFHPKGTKLVGHQRVPIPIGSDHGGGSVFAKFDMNNVGPGGAISSSGGSSSADCTGASASSGQGTPGEVDMKDDYKTECGNYTICSGQCVDFVKFRLKKHIDQNKFDDFTTGTGGVAAYTSSANLGRLYGYEVNHTPAVNSVASWPAKGVAGSHANDIYGHVAMVSKVNADGSIVVEEYNATTPAETYSTRKIPASVANQLTYAHTEVDYK